MTKNRPPIRRGREIPRSWCSVIPRMSFFLLYILVVIRLSATYPEAFLYPPDTFASGLVLFFVFMFFLFVLRPIILMFDSYYEITEDGVHAVEGRLSVKRKYYELSFAEIVGVEVRRGLFDRLCGMGSIGIGTAMTGDVELVLRRVKNPEYYTQLIQEGISKYRGTGGATPVEKRSSPPHPELVPPLSD